MKIPKHVAIILDGNGRWAKSKGMPRNYGHTIGAKNVETVCQAADEIGIKYLTLYAFSTENWNRPDNEVQALMKLLESYLKTCIKTADKNNMRVRVIGEIGRLSEVFQQRIKELEKSSAANIGLNLTIAINYGAFVTQASEYFFHTPKQPLRYLYALQPLLMSVFRWNPLNLK